MLFIAFGTELQFLSPMFVFSRDGQAEDGTSLATLRASSGVLTSPSLPGTVGTPAACGIDTAQRKAKTGVELRTMINCSVLISQCMHAA